MALLSHGSCDAAWPHTGSHQLETVRRMLEAMIGQTLKVVIDQPLEAMMGQPLEAVERRWRPRVGQLSHRIDAEDLRTGRSI